MRDLDGLTAALHERGLRVTPQRQMIHAILAGSPSHPTVDEVYEAVARVLPTVSLRTVYQALHDLETLGEIRLAPIGSSSLRVDVRTDHHAHLLCERCGNVQNVDVDSANLVPPRSQQQGFIVERTDVVFRGRCAPCQEPERGSGAAGAARVSRGAALPSSAQDASAVRARRRALRSEAATRAGSSPKPSAM